MTIKIEATERNSILGVKISNEINEDLDFEKLGSLLKNADFIDLSGIETLTSMGIAMWCRYFEKFSNDNPRDDQIKLLDCSFAVIYQLCYIPEFSSNFEIDTFMIPFYCEACGSEFNVVKKKKEIESLDDPYSITNPCEKCKTDSELSGYCSDYFSFLEPEDSIW